MPARCAAVLQWTGIPVSVGIAPTKTLAKVANHAAKKDEKHGGALLLRMPAWMRVSETMRASANDQFRSSISHANARHPLAMLTSRFPGQHR
jgi:DMSO/TMAO reductase YedYZ molybdopterin-dependent catalytic subunit